MILVKPSVDILRITTKPLELIEIAEDAHPQMREIAGMLLKQAKERMPILFDQE